MKKIWVASTDKSQDLIKMEAVYRAFGHFYPDEELAVESKLVPDESNVSALWHGPLVEKTHNERDTIAAAHISYLYLTEVEYTLSLKPDYYVALSFGLDKSCHNDDYLAFAWAAVSGEYQDPVYGRSQSFALPPNIVHRVLTEGLSLVAALKACYPTQVNQHVDEGLIAILSNGKVTEADIFASAIEMALVHLNNRGLY